MKNNIKKYTDFIGEARSYSKLSNSMMDWYTDTSRMDLIPIKIHELMNLRSDFFTAISNISEFFPGYFSDMCKSDNDPDEEYNNMQKIMSQGGWDIESIKNLFSKKSDDICGYNIFNLISGETTSSKFEENIELLTSAKKSIDKILKPFSGGFISHLTNLNGHCDIYLYKTVELLGLNTDLIPLGGDGWSSYLEEQEILVRYRYGYHHTKYGKLLLKQLKYTPEQFAEKALTYLVEYIEQKENWHYEIFTFFKNENEKNRYKGWSPKKLENDINSLILSDYVGKEEDRLIIYTKEISDDINKLYQGINATTENINSVFTKILSSFQFHIYFTGKELVVEPQELI